MLQQFFFYVHFFQNKNHSSLTVVKLEVSEIMTGNCKVTKKFFT